MAQLKQLEFVKSSALTEMAYTVVNTVWPDVENYFASVGFDSWVDTYTMQDTFVDQSLQKFLYSYFKDLLAKHKFYLKAFNMAFDMGGPENEYGSALVMYESLSYKTQTIPTVIITVNVNQVFSLSENEFMRIMFHELSHIEQQCKILINYTAPKLVDELPINEPIPVHLLADTKGITIDDSTNFSAPDEIGAYANDFALKLFNHYKQDLKSLSIKERDYFLRAEILPKYLSLMSNDMKEHFTALSDSKRNSFLKQLVRQLKEFISGLL